METLTGELTVNILVLNIGGSIQSQKTRAVEYSYKRPPVKSLALVPLKSDLAKAIDQAIRNKVDEMGPLPLEKVTLTTDFGIEKKISVGGQAQFSIVTIGPKVSGSNNTVQSVELVFEKKS